MMRFRRQPGNLNELLMCFDFVRNLPEINALQAGMRKKSGGYIMEAERSGHSEDVCTYVKTDLGMMSKGQVGPNGKPLPTPDLLLLSYTGCFTFMKWFELVRDQYDCETAMLHVPYQADGKITENMRHFVVTQLKEHVIPTLERVSGVKFDIDRLREYLRESAKAEDDLVWVLQSAKNRPSPIDAYFGGVYYCGPIFTAFRGTRETTDYYRSLRVEVEDRLAKGLGPVTPEGTLEDTLKLAAFTTLASATIQITHSKRSPITALAVIQTTVCRHESTCSAITWTSTRRMDSWLTRLRAATVSLPVNCSCCAKLKSAPVSLPDLSRPIWLTRGTSPRPM